MDDGSRQLPRPEPTSEESVALQKAVLGGSSFLYFRRGGTDEGEFTIFFLDTCVDESGVEKVDVGSHPDCDLVLDWDESVDSSHAVFERVGPDWYLDDKKSMNGTQVFRGPYGFVADDEFWLHDEDVIKMGNTYLIFKGPEPLRALQSDQHPDLTRGERGVALRLIAYLIDGGSGELPSNAEIGDQFANGAEMGDGFDKPISEETVKSRMRELFRKYEIPAGKPGNKRRALAEEIVSRGPL